MPSLTVVKGSIFDFFSFPVILCMSKIQGVCNSRGLQFKRSIIQEVCSSKSLICTFELKKITDMNAVFCHKKNSSLSLPCLHKISFGVMISEEALKKTMEYVEKMKTELKT